MPGLIHAQLSAAWQDDLREEAPAFILDVATGDVPLSHVSDKGLYVVAQQKELMRALLASFVQADLRRRQAKDHEAAACIDAAELESIAEECAIGAGIRGVDDGMRADDHGSIYSFHIVLQPH